MSVVRRLGTFDAIVIGLGSMIGAGVFAAIGPATVAAGSGVLLALALAAVVAYCNATSSAQLAAIYPESGGTYVYGREQLGPVWGYLAGFGFVFGKLASCTAMAMTFAYYAAPEYAKPLAVGAVLILTFVNYRGIQKTALVTRVIVSVVLCVLAIAVFAMLSGGAVRSENLSPVMGNGGAYGLLQAAGLLFFAFAGYARIATLAGEVVDPARTIPRAVTVALSITLVIYALVAVSALLAAGAPALAASKAPLATAIEAGQWAALAPIVRVGAAIASLGVLLSLIAGVSRTALAMAQRHDLPSWLAAIHPRFQVPHRADVVIGLIVASAAAVADVRTSIGFSSFLVLIYYAITNASAWTLSDKERLWPRALSALGFLGCVTLALSLPVASVIAGSVIVLVGLVIHALRAILPRRGPAQPK